MIKRLSIFVYGVLSYAVFFATFLYAIGFVGNLWVPKSIDSAREAPFLTALLINLALLGLFAVQHSVMARPAFKRWWTRIVPPAAERSTYVLFSSLALIAAVRVLAADRRRGLERRPSPAGQASCTARSRFGWAAGAVRDVPDQPFRPVRPAPGVAATASASRTRRCTFDTPVLYRYVRHPLYVGWFFVFWSTPTMTVTHLVFAIATTRLHPDRDPARGARPDRRASRVRGVPPSRADARAVHEAAASGAERRLCRRSSPG